MQNPFPSASSPSQPEVRVAPALQTSVRLARQATTVKPAQTPSQRDPRFPHEQDSAPSAPHDPTADATHIEPGLATDTGRDQVPQDPEATATPLSDAHTPRPPGVVDEAQNEHHDKLPAHGPVDGSPAWQFAQANSFGVTVNPSVLSLASADAFAEAPTHAELGHASAPAGATAAGGSMGVHWGWLGLLAAGGGYGVIAHRDHHDADSGAAQEPGLAFTLSGGLLAGPITNKSLIVTAYDARGQVLGSTTTHQDNPTAAGGYGYYTLTINHPGFSGGAVLLRVSDPTAGASDDYIDEATGQSLDVADLRAVVFVPHAQHSTQASALTNTSNSLDAHALQVTAYITPLSTLAAELIAPLPQATGAAWTLPPDTTQDQISQNHQKVAELFDLGAASDLTAMQPVAVISREGMPLSGSNAYGKALAVLSLVQAHNTALSAQALANDLKSSGSEGPLKFSAAVAPQFQQASLRAVTQGYLSTAEAFQLQTSTRAGSSTEAIDFQFERSALTVSELDPGVALGQTVYRITPITTAADLAHPMPANGLRVYNVNTTDPARFRLELLDTVAGSHDAEAFTFDPLAGTLGLKSDAASQVQGAGGHTYRVTLRATADLLATPDNPADDIAITQALTLTVKDTTAPRAPAGYTIAFNAIAGVQIPDTGPAVTTVGTLGVQNPAGLLTLADLAPPDEPGVHYRVSLSLRNRASHQDVTRRWDDWFHASESDRQLVLRPDEIARLGEGTIDVQASVVATDRADLVASPVISTTSFVLDTVVSTPSVSLLNDPASFISGDGWIRLAWLEQGARYTYTVFAGRDATSGPVVSSLANIVHHDDPTTGPGVAALDLHALGSGDYTIQVTQQDAVGNQSSTTQTFTLDLEPPTGVDACIEGFEFMGAGGVSSTHDPLFYLNSEEVGTLKGTWKGQLEDNETLQLGVGRRESDGTVSWQWGDSLLALQEPDLMGVRRWDFDANQVAHWRVELPPTVSGGSLLGIRLVDSLGHTRLLTSRDYIYQTQEVFLPPLARWSDASPESSETTDASLKVVVSGLAAHAQAEYLLSRSPSAPAAYDSAWTARLSPPTPDGNSSNLWYLHVRQRDAITQQVSASGDPLVIHVDTDPPAPVTGLLYQPLDGSSPVAATLATITRDQVTHQRPELDTGWVDDNGQPVYQGQVVTALGDWTAADEGATLSVQWGHVLTTHTLSMDDIYAKKVDLWWNPDDILNQPGQVTVRAWLTDLAGHTSTAYTRSLVVDSRQTVAAVSSTAPAFLGLFTRTNTSDAPVADADYTLNKAEALAGVQLRLQVGLQQADGSPVDWSQGFKLMLFTKSPNDNWSSASVTTGTWSAGSTGNSGMVWNAPTGQVDWTLNLNNPLGNRLFSNMQGDLYDWKVQIQNFAYHVASPLYLTETALAQVKVDTVSPGSLSSPLDGLLSLSWVNEGQRAVSLGHNQWVLPVLVNYAGMAAGDVLEFQSRPSSASTASWVLREELKPGDINGTQAVLSLAREAITQSQGDGVYSLDLRVTDTAGNSTWLANPITVTVDTQGPSAPALSWPVADPQRRYLNDGYLNADELTTDINITWPADHADTDTLHWVLGGTDLDDTRVSQFIRVKQVVTQAGVTTTTYTVDQRVFGSLAFDGVKTLRVCLTDAFGNRGAYSDPLDLVLDSQPHDAPVLSVPATTVQAAAAVPTRFLREDARLDLRLSDPQSVAGDTLHLVVTPAGGEPVLWQQDVSITNPLPSTLSLSQAGDWNCEGQSGFSTAWPSGEYWITATVTDLAGNVSRVSQPYRVVVDLDAPLNKAVAGSFAFAQHAVVDASATPGHHRAFITRTADPTITVQLESALQDAHSPTGAESLWGRVVAPGSTTDATLADDGWIDLSSAVAGNTLTWRTASSGLALQPGMQVIQLQVRDAAGNRGTITEQPYVLDTASPTTGVQAGTLTFSQDAEPTHGQGTPAALGLDRDLQTRYTSQTLRLDLNAALAMDTHDSPTWGAAQEALWASLDNGTTWFDITAFVQANQVTWDLAQTRDPATGALSPLTLMQSSTARFQVIDVAGNRGPEFTQAYVLDTDAPTSQATWVEWASDTGLGGVDAPSHHDFITNQARTSINLSFNQPLSAGDRVYVSLEKDVLAQTYDITADLAQQGAFDAATWRSASPVFNVGADTSGDPNTPFTLLSGRHTLSVWVEDSVGNQGRVLEQPYVYASQAPVLDLDGQGVGADRVQSVSATQAQQGVALGNAISVTGLSTDVAEVVVRVATAISDNGSNERLLVAPGVDVDLNSARPSPLQGLQLPGIAGTVQWTPYGGGEMHFAKQDDAGQAAFWSATEVQRLLEGLRYFNTANSDDITPGTRSFSIQLLDRATNLSTPRTASLRVMAADSTEMSTSANAGQNTIVGTAGDDLLFGLQGQDSLTGNGGNNTFLWLSGDATSPTRTPVTDVITDFHAWNASTLTGDRLDISSLLQGYTAASPVANYLTVDNRAVVNGVANSTRLTVHVDGTHTGAVQVIELPGVSLGTAGASSGPLLQELMANQQLRVL